MSDQVDRAIAQQRAAMDQAARQAMYEGSANRCDQGNAEESPTKAELKAQLKAAHDQLQNMTRTIGALETTIRVLSKLAP